MGGIPGTLGPYPGAALFKGELARPPLQKKASLKIRVIIMIVVIIIMLIMVIVRIIIIIVLIIITMFFSHLVGETRPREDKMPRPEGEIMPRGRDMPVGDHDHDQSC